MYNDTKQIFMSTRVTAAFQPLQPLSAWNPVNCLFNHVFWFSRQGSTVLPKCQQKPTWLFPYKISLTLCWLWSGERNSCLKNQNTWLNRQGWLVLQSLSIYYLSILCNLQVMTWGSSHKTQLNVLDLQWSYFSRWHQQTDRQAEWLVIHRLPYAPLHRYGRV